MADIEGLLNRWQKAGVLEAESANRIRAFESEQKRPTGLRWQGMVALILGALLLACGVVLFVSAHWGNIGPGARYAIIMGMIAVFHIAGGYTRAGYYGLSTAFHAVGTLATGAAIALVGQIFNIQDHWPAAVLLWAIAALAGWILLHDEIQQSLTLLLLPAWIFSEFAFSTERHIGQSAYLGRFLFVWAILYLTASLGWRRRVVQGILFTAAAIASVCGIVSMLENWRSWSAEQTFLPLSTRLWGWTIIDLLPVEQEHDSGDCGNPVLHRVALVLPALDAGDRPRYLPRPLHLYRSQPRRSRAGDSVRGLHHLVGRTPGQPRTRQPRYRRFCHCRSLVLLQRRI